MARPGLKMELQRKVSIGGAKQKSKEICDRKSLYAKPSNRTALSTDSDMRVNKFSSTGYLQNIKCQDNKRESENFY
jgi:hypothetical protein